MHVVPSSNIAVQIDAKRRYLQIHGKEQKDPTSRIALPSPHDMVVLRNLFLTQIGPLQEKAIELYA